jgi:hypothetical protein
MMTPDEEAEIEAQLNAPGEDAFHWSPSEIDRAAERASASATIAMVADIAYWIGYNQENGMVSASSLMDMLENFRRMAQQELGLAGRDE